MLTTLTVVVFFKQKTAYEMRISDWSSDVCSSDLYAGVAAEEASARITSVPRTVIDCARALPFDAALAVADSALRQGKVTRTQLHAAAEASPRSGRSKAVRVAREADRRAANPFESVLRAIALDRGVRREPQRRCHEFM